MRGPGKYDKWAEDCRKRLGARGVLLIVVEGKDGSGSSLKAPLEVMIQLPRLMRLMAEQIEVDIHKLAISDPHEQIKRQANN